MLSGVYAGLMFASVARIETSAKPGCLSPHCIFHPVDCLWSQWSAWTSDEVGTGSCAKGNQSTGPGGIMQMNRESWVSQYLCCLIRATFWANLCASAVSSLTRRMGLVITQVEKCTVEDGRLPNRKSKFAVCVSFRKFWSWSCAGQDSGRPCLGFWNETRPFSEPTEDCKWNELLGRHWPPGFGLCKDETVENMVPLSPTILLCGKRDISKDSRRQHFWCQPASGLKKPVCVEGGVNGLNAQRPVVVAPAPATETLACTPRVAMPARVHCA